MYIVYFLVLSKWLLFAHENDNCNNKMQWLGSQQPCLNETVIRYRDKSGDCFLKQVYQMNDTDFDRIVSNFKKALNVKSSENVNGHNAIAAHVTSFYVANQKAIIIKKIQAQEHPAQYRFRALLNRFHGDMNALWKEFNTLDDQASLKRFELPCGLMCYKSMGECYGQKRQLERALNALYIERTQVFRFNELFQKIPSEKITNLLSNQYEQLRLHCFEELLRFALKNDWDSLYDYPGQVLLNDILVRAITGKDAQFLYKSKNYLINGYIDQDAELKSFHDVLESLLINISTLPLNVKSLQFYNNESFVYGKPQINTPTDYFNHLKKLRSNHWMCRYIQMLYKQANSTVNESWFEEDEAFDKELKMIIHHVFEEFDLHDQIPDELEW